MLLLRLLFDFGLVVLIWLVQLVIYPGFKYYSPAGLQQWHKIYTTRIAIVVIPLMLGQLALAAWQLWYEQNFYTSGSMFLVILTWLLTFTVFVPLHSSITKDPGNRKATRELVKKNWYRTALWSLIFLLSFSYNKILI